MKARKDRLTFHIQQVTSNKQQTHMWEQIENSREGRKWRKEAEAGGSRVRGRKKDWIKMKLKQGQKDKNACNKLTVEAAEFKEGKRTESKWN